MLQVVVSKPFGVTEYSYTTQESFEHFEDLGRVTTRRSHNGAAER